MKFLASVLMIMMAMPAGAQEVPTSKAQIALSFAPLVREAAPAVVNIYARVVRPARPSPFRGDPFFERFFDGFAQERPRVQNSLGSGVILSPDGVVVSNHHVVGAATEIRVVLADRREYEAEVLLADAESDLAILALKEAEDLPHLNLRKSDEVEVGELVLAIGNPFGVGQTVSSGIVSGLARSGAAGGGGLGYFIQTDAPINPGNSGGALIDMAGRLIGINTSILTRSGGSNGIGFAIPADLVAAFVAQAEAGRRVFVRPWAGITGQSVDAAMAEAFGLGVPGGVAISSAHPLSPFVTAGLEVGDVILSVGGQPVNTASELIYRMTVGGLGRDAEVRYLRDGTVGEVRVVLETAPERPARDTLVLEARHVLAGMRVERVNPAVIEEYGLAPDAEGVVVADPERLGLRVGLARGDVIEAINDIPILHPEDVARALASSEPGYVLTLRRGFQRLVLRFRV